jgi:hypothetical protein
MSPCLLTVDRSEPQDDAMKPIRRKGAYRAKHAEYEDSEKDRLVGFPALIGEQMHVISVEISYGSKTASLSRVCITAVAITIWEIVYAKLATPAA